MTNMKAASPKPRYVNLADAKARLSALVDRAATGEEIVIAKDHRPVAKLVPLRPSAARRRPGSAKGQIRVAPNFDLPLADFDDYTR
jgi:prevent-host-death family protein